jgi:hypothetical protein
MRVPVRWLAACLLAGLSTGCDCWFFKHGKDQDSSSAAGGSGQGSGGSGGGGGGGTGGGGGGNAVPEIDPSALRGGLAVLVCGTLILADRQFRRRGRAESRDCASGG